MMALANILREGERLCLRQAEEQDLDYIMELTHAPENKPFIVPFDREMHEKAIANPTETMDIIVERKEDGARVGYFYVHGLKSEAKEIEWTHVIMGVKGQGYGHEAMKLIKAWSFLDKGFHRAWLDCKDYNERALHLYESEGMIREGLIRETLLTDGRYENLVILGMLDREYMVRRAEGLEI